MNTVTPLGNVKVLPVRARFPPIQKRSRHTIRMAAVTTISIILCLHSQRYVIHNSCDHRHPTKIVSPRFARAVWRHNKLEPKWIRNDMVDEGDDTDRVMMS